MKIKEILHKDTRVYKILPLWARITLDHIHALQEKVEMLMANLETTQDSVTSNTTYRETGKYVTPAGRFKTYAAAAAGNNITTYMVKKHLRDIKRLDYYIDLDQPTTITIPEK